MRCCQLSLCRRQPPLLHLHLLSLHGRLSGRHALLLLLALMNPLLLKLLLLLLPRQLLLLLAIKSSLLLLHLALQGCHLRLHPSHW